MRQLFYPLFVLTCMAVSFSLWLAFVWVCIKILTVMGFLPLT